MRANLLGLGIPVVSVLILSLTAAKQPKEQAKPTVQLAQIALPKDSINSESLYSNKVNALYDSLQLETKGLSLPVFEKAITGFYNLKSTEKASDKPMLSIVNFDQLSTEKRLYVIDVEKQELVLNTWVAHGSTSGKNEAIKFARFAQLKWFEKLHLV